MNGEAKLSALEARQLREIDTGAPPGDMADEKARLRLKYKGLAVRDQGAPWRWHLTPEGSLILGAG